MGDIQFDRVPAIAPAGEPHVRNSSDAPQRQGTAERQAKRPPNTENAEEDANQNFAMENDNGIGSAADDADPPHILDRFA